MSLKKFHVRRVIQEWRRMWSMLAHTWKTIDCVKERIDSCLSGSEFSANGVSINVRKLSSKTHVICDYTIGPTLVRKNMAAIPCNAWIPAIRHARCQKLFLFPQSVAKQKKKAELFCKERLWKDFSRSDGKDSTRSTRKKGRSGTDHQRVWDTAEDEPEYPGWSFV